MAQKSVFLLKRKYPWFRLRKCIPRPLNPRPHLLESDLLLYQSPGFLGLRSWGILSLAAAPQSAGPRPKGAGRFGRYPVRHLSASPSPAQPILWRRPNLNVFQSKMMKRCRCVTELLVESSKKSSSLLPAQPRGALPGATSAVRRPLGKSEAGLDRVLGKV